MNRSASNDRAPLAGLPGVARSSAFASAKGVLLRWFVALVAVVAVSSFAAIHLTRPELTPITSDGFDYYAYLPDWFLFHETTLQAVADDCCGGRYPDWTAMTRSPRTGRWLNPHPIGVAVLTAPFFGLAHGLTLWSGLPPDGFSLYYQCAAALAGLSFMLGGLAILRTLLRTHVTDGVALATLAALTFGTNLFHYGVFDATYSHAFSFGLVCALMALAESWWERPRPWRTVGLGLVAGLLVLVRHPNALLLVVVPLVGLTWKEGARQWLARVYERRWQVAAALAIAAFVVAPQVALYRAAAGSWLANPYGAAGGSFAFLSSPRIAGVLFSVQKGLFFWSPVLLLALPAIACTPGAAQTSRVVAFRGLPPGERQRSSSWRYRPTCSPAGTTGSSEAATATAATPISSRCSPRFSRPLSAGQPRDAVGGAGRSSWPRRSPLGSRC